MNTNPPATTELGPAAPPAKATSGLAFASLIFSVLGMGLIGIICGHVSLSRIKRAQGQLGGRNLAVAGLILGYVTVIGIIAVALALATGVTVFKSQADMSRTTQAMEQLETSLNRYYAEYGKHPFDGTSDVKLASNGSLMDLLRGKPGMKNNPREIAFFFGGSGLIDSQGNLVDAWGRPYEILLDTDSSGQIDLGGEKINRPIAVRSSGPDQLFGTEDDIRTW